MNEKALIVLKAYLNKKSNEKLFNFIGEQLKQKLLKLPSVTLKEKIKYNLLDGIHYSWLIPALRICSKNDSALLLSIMSKKNQEELSLRLSTAPSSGETSALVKSYLKNYLLSSVINDNSYPLPISFLPDSPLNVLAETPKNKLIQIIDYLALYDLAKGLRKIVSKEVLQKIDAYLTEPEIKFLKKAKLEHYLFASQIPLEKNIGNNQDFRRLLHKTGLKRLAKALKNETLDLIWYICHHLDIGRGSELHNLIQNEKAQKNSEMMNQVIKVLNFLSIK